MSGPQAAAHADRRPFLAARAKILSALRAWFAAEGFWETDVGALVPTPGAEIHIEAIQAGGAYLHTSPEFAMKKLLAAGETAIFRLGFAYRAGERGPLHAPEFTLLEWYRAGASYERVMDDCLALLRAAAAAIGASTLNWRGAAAEVHAPATRLSVRDAFQRYAGAPPHSAYERDTDLFSALLVEHVEPRLGLGAPCFLQDYPLHEAALARPCAHDPSLAERFELYACGVELANGYGELTDPVEQRARFHATMAEKQRIYGTRWPADESFFEAVAHLPPSGGCALGVDRLIMLLTGARTIDDVLWSLPP